MSPATLHFYCHVKSVPVVLNFRKVIAQVTIPSSSRHVSRSALRRVYCSNCDFPINKIDCPLFCMHTAFLYCTRPRGRLDVLEIMQLGSVFQWRDPTGSGVCPKYFPNTPMSSRSYESKISPWHRAHIACKCRSLQLPSAWGACMANSKGNTISTQMSHARLNLKSMNKKDDCPAELDG
jgi:hypothetical protein